MKLVIRKKDNLIYFLTYEDERIKMVDVTEINAPYLLGNFYIGKVKNVVKNINVAFIDIGDDNICFLALNEVKNPLILNRTYDGKGIKVNDEILVQIIGESVGSKKPKATTSFEYQSDNLVVAFNKSQIKVSNKIEDKEEKERIKSILKEYDDGNTFLLARTSAKSVDREILVKEIEDIKKLNLEITTKSKHLSCFSFVYGVRTEFEAILKEGLKKGYEKIITDDEEIFNSVKEIVNITLGNEVANSLVNLYDTDTINALYNLDIALEKALAKNVWLKSGGNIVIEQTEALVSIDVNSKKAIDGKKDLEKTFLKINKEAAIEVCRQLVLKNLSGIIIVDFIDMRSQENKDELVSLLKSELLKDPVKAVFVDFTALGLVEITRKKVKLPLGYKLRIIGGLR